MKVKVTISALVDVLCALRIAEIKEIGIDKEEGSLVIEVGERELKPYSRSGSIRVQLNENK